MVKKREEDLGEIRIRNLSKDTIEYLKILAKENGYESTSKFMENQINTLLKNEVKKRTEDNFSSYFLEVKSTQKAVLKILLDQKSTDQDVLNRLILIEELISKWLEFQGYGDDKK